MKGVLALIEAGERAAEGQRYLQSIGVPDLSAVHERLSVLGQGAEIRR